MPSASSAKVPAAATQDKDMKLPVDLTEPFKQVVTLVEHKIRNMEKRKLKLDGYKQEQEQGKDLNADQLSAVAKYGELMQSLDFARDLSKQVSQIQLETSRMIKKQNKREQLERLQAESERTKEIMILTNWLHRLVMLPHVRADFVNGTNPKRITLTTDENQAIDELASINLANFDASVTASNGIVQEHFSNLIEGKDKAIPKTSTTYSHMKKLLLSLNSVSYSFEHPKYHVPKSDSGDADISADSEEISVMVDSAQHSNEPANYNYVQNMIESPDMDPAVVVTSTNAPPQLMTQQLATMQQVITQNPHNTSQPDYEGQEDGSLEGFNGSSTIDNDVHLQIQSQGSGHTPQGQLEGSTNDLQDQQQEWEHKTGKYGEYGASAGGDGIEGNDFMENNFSTWEGTQSGDGNGNNRGNFRRGGGRYQNSNGYQGRGGNRYQGGSGNRWAPQGERYDDHRGGRNENRGDRGESGDYKPRGGGMRAGRGGNGVDPRGGGERNYYNSGYRNGAPRGGSGGGARRPYRGGYSNNPQEQAPPSGAY